MQNNRNNRKEEWKFSHKIVIQQFPPAVVRVLQRQPFNAYEFPHTYVGMSNFNEADVNRDKDGKFANKPGAGVPPEVGYVSLATDGIPSTTVADPKAQAAKEARRTQQAYREGHSPFANYVSAATGGIVSETRTQASLSGSFRSFANKKECWADLNARIPNPENYDMAAIMKATYRKNSDGSWKISSRWPHQGQGAFNKMLARHKFVAPGVTCAILSQTTPDEVEALEKSGWFPVDKHVWLHETGWAAKYKVEANDGTRFSVARTMRGDDLTIRCTERKPDGSYAQWTRDLDMHAKPGAQEIANQGFLNLLESGDLPMHQSKVAGLKPPF